jgi:hypothetical protein
MRLFFLRSKKRVNFQWLILRHCILISLIINSFYTSAADYSTYFYLDLNYEHDNNIGLRDTNPTAISGYNISPGMGLSYRRDTFKAALDTTLNFAEFDKDQYNSDDQHLELDLEKKSTKNLFQFDTGIHRDSSRTAELLDTGRVTDKAVRRESVWLRPSWLYSFDSKNSVQLSTHLQDVEYQSDNFVDYRYGQLDLSWIYSLRPRTSLHLQAFGSQFKNDRLLGVDSETFGLGVGGRTALSQNLTLHGLVGMTKVGADYSNDEPLDGAVNQPFNDRGYVLDANLVYRHQRHRWALALVSDTQPSGNGYEQRSERLSLLYRNQLKQRLEFIVRAIYGENESQDDAIDDARTYSRLETGLKYRLSKTWSLEGRYRALSQDQQHVSGDARSSAVFFTLSYKPQSQL